MDNTGKRKREAKTTLHPPLLDEFEALCLHTGLTPSGGWKLAVRRLAYFGITAKPNSLPSANKPTGGCLVFCC